MIRVVVENRGRLSKRKRALFARFADDELAKAEALIRAAFNDWLRKYKSIPYVVA